MKSLLRLSALFVLASFTANPVIAQERWSGFYAGAHVGGCKASAGTLVEGRASGIVLPNGFLDGRNTSMDMDSRSASFGGQLGYNWQHGKALFGIEGDISAPDIKVTKTEPIFNLDGTVLAGGIARTSQEIKLLSSIRCRIGYAPSDRWLTYLTGGLAIAEVKYSSDMDYRNVPGYGLHLPAESRKRALGSVIGAGVECALAGGLSARLEYLYYDLHKRTEVGSSTPITLPNDFQYTWSASAQTLRLGLNVRF